MKLTTAIADSLSIAPTTTISVSDAMNSTGSVSDPKSTQKVTSGTFLTVMLGKIISLRLFD